jgi:hypothetical protein
MIEWDENEHGHLASEDLPSNSTRRKYLYRQMALTILDGPLGKGNRIVLPGPSDTIGNHVESYVRFKSLKDSIGVEIFRWDG